MRRALAVLAVLAAAAASGCCERRSRTYVIDAPDPDLMAVLQACGAMPPCYQNGSYCVSMECRTACNRVVELSGDALGGLESCQVTLAPDGGTGARVFVSYNDCR